MASGKGSNQKVCGLAISQSGTELCLVGVKFIKIFDLGTRSLKGKNVIIGKMGKIQTFLCCQYTLDYLAVGTAIGDVYIIQDTKLIEVVSAHKVIDNLKK